MIVHASLYNDLIRSISSEKVGSVSQCHYIVGKKGYGKTALLKQINAYLNEVDKFEPIYVDCLLNPALSVDWMIARENESSRRVVWLLDGMDLFVAGISEKEQFRFRAMIYEENAPIVIRIGFVSGSLQGTAARELAKSAKKDSRFRFHITEGSAKDLMDLLHQEKLDLAIVDVTSRDRSLHFRKLRQRDFFVAVPMGHPLAGQPRNPARQRRRHGGVPDVHRPALVHPRIPDYGAAHRRGSHRPHRH